MWLRADQQDLRCLLPPTTLKEPKGFKNTRPEPRSETVHRFARIQGQKQGSTPKGLNRSLRLGLQTGMVVPSTLELPGEFEKCLGPRLD